VSVVNLESWREGKWKKRTRSHVACDMLRTGESSAADGAFVVTSHLEGRERKRRWSSVSSTDFTCSSLSLNDVVVELPGVWLC
jgi:hypothetical protein